MRCWFGCAYCSIRKGKLNSSIINDTLDIPSVSSYIKHFGSLRKAFALIGYVSPRDCDWIDTREHWSEVLATHTTQVAEALKADIGLQARVDETGAVVTVNGKCKIFFVAARQLAKKKASYSTQWRAYRRKIMSGLLVVLRLDEGNRGIADYLLLPGSEMTGPYLRCSDASTHGATRIETLAELILDIKARLRERGSARKGSTRQRRRSN